MDENNTNDDLLINVYKEIDYVLASEKQTKNFESKKPVEHEISTSDKTNCVVTKNINMDTVHLNDTVRNNEDNSKITCESSSDNTTWKLVSY